MRRIAICIAALAVAYSALSGPVSAFGWRRLDRRTFWSNSGNRSCCSRRLEATSRPVPIRLGKSGSPVGSETVENARSSPINTSHSDAGRRYASADERRCAELGPDRCKMIYPKYDDDGPYPACKVWKCWPDDGGGIECGWEWSELNCPWKQCHDCNDD